MARSRQAKSAERILDAWLSGPVAAKLDEECAGYAAAIIEGFRSFVSRQGDEAALAALAVDRIVCASLLARDLTMKARGEPKKEYVEMAIKANEHACKLLAMNSDGGERTRRKDVVGIGSRMRPIVLKAEGAVEAAITETERGRKAAGGEEQQA